MARMFEPGLIENVLRDGICDETVRFAGGDELHRRLDRFDDRRSIGSNRLSRLGPDPALQWDHRQSRVVGVALLRPD